MTSELILKTLKTQESEPILKPESTQSSRKTKTISKRTKTVKSIDKSKKPKTITKSKKSKKSGRKSVEKNEKRMESKEDMPPTANSQKSAEKARKKLKIPEEVKKEEPKKEALSEELRAATPIDAVKAPSQTPVPTITPGAWSDPARTPEELKPKKKEKKRRKLKRETNHIYHLRPGVNQKVEYDRQKNFRDELLKFETGEFSYLTDPTRYRFRWTPPIEVVIQFVFPSLLILVIALSTAAVVQFLGNDYEHEAPFNEMSELTLTKYDTFLIVRNFEEYINNRTVLLMKNCPGLVQGPYRKMYEHEKRFLNYEQKVVKNAWKAVTYRWTHQVDAVIRMNFDCPPSVIIEMEQH